MLIHVPATESLKALAHPNHASEQDYNKILTLPHVTAPAELSARSSWVKNTLREYLLNREYPNK